MGQRELEVLGDKLFDVRAPDLVGGGDFDDFEDLHRLDASVCMFGIDLLVPGAANGGIRLT